MRSGLSSRLRQKPCALLYRAAQFKNFGGADSPAKQQVAIDCLSVVGDVGNGRSGTPTRTRLIARLHKGTGRSNLGSRRFGAKRNNDARGFVMRLSAEELAPVPAHPIIDSQ